jgi:hypothetical protein
MMDSNHVHNNHYKSLNNLIVIGSPKTLAPIAVDCEPNKEVIVI